MGDYHHDGIPFHFLSNHRDETRNGSRVEARGGFVEKKKPRRVDQSPCERDALTLPAGVRPHRTVGECAELEAFGGARERVLDVDAVQPRRQLDVFPPREVAVAKRVVPHPPERAPHFSSSPTERSVVDLAGRRLGEPPYEREERRFAGPVRPQDEPGLARAEPSRDAHQGSHGAEGLRHGAQLDADRSLGRLHLSRATTNRRGARPEAPSLRDSRDSTNCMPSAHPSRACYSEKL
jgi:hypothetical protein